ncbi:cytochrome c family protein [Leptospira koniambonensis]|uniref:cytochrome c family protein n=1 Tax=Leptospira koniambonensis TaxID=2484950 RepID=UPI001FCA3EFF|nr:cytochrome c family protein [Leptospira koniambonensis]
MNSRHFFVLFLSILFCGSIFCKSKEEDIKTLRFSNGVYPIFFDIAVDSVKNLKTGKLSESSADCGTCHKKIYENWRGSRHSQAFTNPLYKQSHEKEPMSWCLNCHAPFLQANSDPKDPNQRLQSEDGVSCITCHVRDGKILVNNLPTQTENVHEYKQTELLASEEFCANCHQFNFPDKESVTKQKNFISYSNLPMQNTVEEWKQSYWHGKKNCQSCHLLPNSSKSHTFPGGHHIQKLRDSFSVFLEKSSESTYIVSLFAEDIGHSFPTGDLFRSLRLRVLDQKGIVIQEWRLGKTYEENRNASLTDAIKYLSEDSVLDPPKDRSKSSSKKFVFRSITKEKQFRYELFIDFVNPTTHIFGKLNSESTLLKFKSGELTASEWNGSKG